MIGLLNSENYNSRCGFTVFSLPASLFLHDDVVLVDNGERPFAIRQIVLIVLLFRLTAIVWKLPDLSESKADALVALTASDELNMITCSLVDSVYPDVIKIARVRNDEYYANSKLLASQKHLETTSSSPLYGINVMVHPDVEAARTIVAAYEHGAVAKVMEFKDSSYAIASVDIEKGSNLEGIFLCRTLNRLFRSVFDCCSCP